jgi:hypothetical protein
MEGDTTGHRGGLYVTGKDRGGREKERSSVRWREREGGVEREGGGREEDD